MASEIIVHPPIKEFTMQKFFVIAALTLGLGSTACVPADKEKPAAEAPATKDWPITGEVLGFKSENRVLILKHDKIEGLMDAMTMGFELKDPALAKGLAKGDKVEGVLTTSVDAYVITALKKR
jgi:Cu/Ag efflux protein CusF